MMQRMQLQVKAAPITNGQTVNSDEEVVQSLWNKVRSTFQTNMQAVTFSQLTQQGKFQNSSALYNYINRNDDIEVVPDERLRTPNGNTQIAREVTLAANVQNAMNLGGAMLLMNRVQEHKMLQISHIAYQKLKAYMEKNRPAVAMLTRRENTNGNAFAMALMLGALMAASEDDD